MDLQRLEEVIMVAQGAPGNGGSKAQANAMLDSLRHASDRWTLGLKCFFDSTSDTAKLFGLSLIRDYLSRAGCSPEVMEHRRTIRENVLRWSASSVVSGMQIPSFIMNSVVTILTLGIKFEYPRQWPSAFDDILPLAETGPHGLDLVVRVLSELEVEVVMFTEQRTDEEKRNNTMIKDSMRASPVIANVVSLLCRNTVAMYHAGHNELAERCLRCLAELISWIELQLVIQEALPTLYRALSIPQFTAAACSCLYEILKKGMDSVIKVRMIHSIDMMSALLTVPSICNGSGSSSASSAGSPQGGARGLDFSNGNGTASVINSNGSNSSNGGGGGGAGGGSSSSSSNNSSGGGNSGNGQNGIGIQSLSDAWVEEYGIVIDMLFLELLSCWGRFEDVIQAAAQGKEIEGAAEYREVAPLCATMLHTTMPIVLEIFSHESNNVCATVLPALNKLMSTLRAQLLLAPGLIASQSQTFPARYFAASDYVPMFLTAVYKQMQYEENFGFDASDDDDVAVMEAKKDVRKLFVNCCRLFPEACLALIRGAFSTLQQPLSQSPFSQLEAALRLAYAFSECGQSQNKLLSEGQFAELICALHGTDLAQHKHSQVILAYFELSVRYLNLSLPLASTIAATMAGPRGLFHPDLQVRVSAAQSLLRLVERLNAQAIDLLPLTGTFADLILNVSMRSTLTEQAELHLLEASSLLTSLPSNEHVAATQQQLLQKMIAVLAHQIQQCLSMVPEGLTGCPDHLLETMGHKIVSLAALAKGHKCKAFPQTALLFAPPAGLITTVLQRCAASSVIRAKTCVFLHRMVACLGLPICELLVHPGCFLHMLACADISDVDVVVQVLINTLVEYREQAVQLAEFVLPHVVNKYQELFAQLDQQLASGNASLHLESERFAVQRQYLLFIQNLALTGCHEAFTSANNAPMLEHIFKGVLQGLRGGGGGGENGSSLSPSSPSSSSSSSSSSPSSSSSSGGIPLRKSALVILTSLVVPWSRPPTPPPLSEAFQSFLLQQALPAIISDLTDGVTLDFKDAGTHLLITEVGGLIWTVASNYGGQDCAGRLAVALQQPGALRHPWSPDDIQTLCQAVANHGPLINSFKDSFKRFMKRGTGGS